MVGLLASASCQTWQAAAGTPRAALTAERPASIRLTLSSGEVVTVEDPSLRGDSVVSAADARPVAALSDITVLEVRRLHALRSAGFALAIVAVAASWAATVGSVSGGGTRTPEPPFPKN